ncbi:MAG TPA: P-loop NTPase [Polyangia bacterium]|nr:P-loop NTPase [Polyangia bacterium]
MGRVELLARGRWHRPPPTSRGTRVIAVGSAGDRVGQSTVAAQLAIATANLGAQVIAVDLDRRTPALAHLLGVEQATTGWRALLDQAVSTLDSALTRAPVRNLQMLAEGAARDQSSPDANRPLGPRQRRVLIQQLRALGADLVILDLGAQSPDDLADWFSLSELGLVVTSPERSAMAAWLAFFARVVSRQARPAPASGAASPPLPSFRARVIGNQASAPEDAELFHAFSRLLRSELSLDIPVIGYVQMQERLGTTASAHPAPGRPGSTFDGNAQAFLRMGELLLYEQGSAGDAPPAEPPAADAPGVPDSAPAITPREIAEADALLSARLEPHRRKRVRIEVAWAATLEVDTRRIAVRVADVSLSGAALEVVSVLVPGSQGTLILDQLPGQPDIPVMVKSLRPELGRAGVAFVGAEAMRRALMATAEDQRGPAVEVTAEDEFEEEPTLSLRVTSEL